MVFLLGEVLLLGKVAFVLGTAGKGLLFAEGFTGVTVVVLITANN